MVRGRPGRASSSRPSGARDGPRQCWRERHHVLPLGPEHRSRPSASLAPLALRATQLSFQGTGDEAGWLSSHRDCAKARGAMPRLVHQFISLSARCSSRWWARHSGTVNSSLTFCPSSRACTNRRWCDRRAVAHTLCRVGARQNADASCHGRRVNGNARTLLSMRSCGFSCRFGDPGAGSGSGLFQVSQPGSERPSHLVAIGCCQARYIRPRARRKGIQFCGVDQSSDGGQQAVSQAGRCLARQHVGLGATALMGCLRLWRAVWPLADRRQQSPPFDGPVRRPEIPALSHLA